MSGVQLRLPYLAFGSAPLLTISRTAAAFPSRAAATSGGTSRGPAKQPARRTAQAGNPSRMLAFVQSARRARVNRLTDPINLGATPTPVKYLVLASRPRSIRARSAPIPFLPVADT